MKILYDYQTFSAQRFGGVSKCFCELISNMPSDVETEIAVKYSRNSHLITSGLVPNLNITNGDRFSFVREKPFPGKYFLYDLCSKYLPTSNFRNRQYAIEAIKGGEFDVFHPTYFYDYYLPYIWKKPFVLTIHDMMPEVYPSLFPKNYWQVEAKKYLAEKASAIVAVSQNTKDDILKFIDVNPDKIHVVYHGGPQVEIIQGESLIDTPYFLYVGLRNAYKNFAATIKDFSVFTKSHPEVKMVFTGKPFNSEEWAILNEFGVANKVMNYFASDEEMKLLYKHAIAFVYPSLYEGFGMPILEAYAYGCPVLLNNKSCFPEIAQEAAVYFELDEQHQNLSVMLEKVYNFTTEERNCLIEKQYDRLKCFSWSDSAKKLSSIYQSLI